jgi:hypothetical protein
MIYHVSYKEDEKGEKFYFIDVGSEDHGRPSFRLWVSAKLIIRDENGRDIIKFPVNATIVKTEKGSLILKPQENFTVRYIFVNCGYRGGASFEILEPKEAQIFEFREYRSPRGNCGISKGALVVIPKGTVLKYKWKRTGRTYGGPTEGITIQYEDGKEVDFEGIPDGLEELENIKKELE